MKEKQRKKLFKRWLDKNAIKIMCRYCDAKDTCKSRMDKEKKEKEGLITRCTFTPNKKIKYPSWAKVDKNGNIVNINRNGIPMNRGFNGEFIKDDPKQKNGYKKPFKKEDKPINRKDTRR